MKIGFIGLGKMGKAMVLHALEEGVDVVVYNRSSEKIDGLKSEIRSASWRTKSETHSTFHIPHSNRKQGRMIPAYSIEELVNQLETPRVMWLMVEHGKPVDEVIEKLIAAGVTKDDIIIDGGNSFFKDSVRRYTELKEKGIHYLDVGTSGGLLGAREGACLMIGGEKEIFEALSPLFSLLAGSKGGVAYFGPTGAGHFVKMVHNGVEYGMLQAIGEGFEILGKGMPVTKPFARGTLAKTVKLDLWKVAQNWNRGSVVRGWLMELAEKAFQTDPNLSRVEGVVGGGSTGEWTVATAKELGVETPVITDSLRARKKSLAKPTFSGKVVAALRREFGGHEVKKI